MQIYYLEVTMGEVNKVTQSSSIRYALSFQMKYGEVLHVENLQKEEKDKYLDFARKDNASMLVEDRNTLRNLHSNDIAKVSVVAYDMQKDESSFKIKKMLYSESSLGRPLFRGLIKLYIAIAVLGIIGFFGIAMVENGFIDIFLDMEKFIGGFSKGIDFASLFFKLMAAVMLVLAFTDLLLGLNTKYFRNQDGEEPPMTTRLSNLTLVVVFMIVVIFIQIAFNMVAS